MFTLIVDDNPARHEVLRALGVLQATSAYSADVAKMRLGIRYYDYVLLDHDLVGQFQNPDEPTSGMEVVRYFEAERRSVGKIICHSLNAAMRRLQVERLKAAGYDAYEIPFSSYRLIAEMVA